MKYTRLLDVIEISLYKTNFHVINRYLPALNADLENLACFAAGSDQPTWIIRLIQQY